MIIDFFIDIINGLLYLLPGLPALPAFSGFTALINVFETVNYYFPVAEFLVAATAYLVLIKFKVQLRIARWVLERWVI